MHPGLPAVLSSMTRIADITLRSIDKLWWTADGGVRIQLEHATAIPPLARTLLDSVFTVVFLFDSPTQNTRWYHASGWRDIASQQVRLEKTYGEDPAWREWLDDHAKWIEQLKVDVTPVEIQTPARIEWWPNPGKMTKFRRDKTPYIRDAERRDFLQYLNDWHYGPLSSDSHLSYMGMIRRAGVLADGPNRVQLLEQYASNIFLTSLTLNLAFLAEVIAEANLSVQADRAIQLWSLVPEWPMAQSLFLKRYQKLLTRRRDG